MGKHLRATVQSHVMEVTEDAKLTKNKHVAGKTMNKLTSNLTRTEWKGNNALPHHNCSGSQLFCTSNPTTPLPRTQIQSEAAITREAKHGSADCCETTFCTHNSAPS